MNTEIYYLLIKAVEQSNEAIAALMPKNISPYNDAHMAAYSAFHANRVLLNKVKEWENNNVEHKKASNPS